MQADLFATVFESSPNILMLVNEDAHVEMINRTGVQFSGVPQEELLNLLGGEVLRCVNSFNNQGCGRGPECKDCPVRTRVKRSFQKGETILNEEGRLTVRRGADELPVDFLISTVPVITANETKVLVTIVDISKRKRVEEALQESEERYRLLFNEMLSGFALHEIICDEQGKPIDYRFLAVNSAFEALTGLTANELIGKTVMEVLPGTEPFWIERYGKVALEGKTDQFDGFSAALGKHYEARAFCPEPGKFAVMFHDVTEHKKAGEELRKSKQALEEAERLVHLGHYEIDIETGKAVWSDEIFHIFGLDPQNGEPTVETYYDLIHPDDRSKVRELYEESAQKNIPFDLVYRIIRTGGEVRYVHSSASVIRDDAARLRLFGTFQDITELKQTELALQESEALYHDLVETAQDLIWQCDWEGRYVYLNPAWEVVLGYKLDEMLGKSFTDFQPPAYARRDQETFLQLMEGKSITRYETAHLSKDGRELQLVFNAKAVRDAQGNIIGTRGTAYDNTERNYAERELRENAAQLESIREVSLELTSQLDLDTLLHFIANKAVELLDAIGGGVYLYRPERDVLEWVVGVNSPLPVGSTLNLGEGLAGKVWQNGKPMLVDDYQHWEGRAEVYDRFEFGAALGAPIFLRNMESRDEFLGVLSIDRTSAFSEPDIKLLSLFTNQAAVAINNAQLYKLAQHEIEERTRAELALRRRANELAALQKTILEITQPHTLAELLKFIVERAANLFDASGGGLYLNEPEFRQVRCVVSYNTPHDYTGTTLAYGVGAAGLIAQSGKPLIIDDYRSWLGRAEAYEEEHPFQAVMSAPMLWQGNVTGVLHMLRNGSQKFTEEDLNLLILFANHASVVVENARLYSSIEQELAERKRTEDALRNSGNLLKESEKIAGMGHYVLDINTGVWESSDSLNELFGIDKNYQTNFEGWLQIVHPDDREAMETYFEHEVVKERREFDREYRIARVADGVTRWVHGLGRLEFDGDGKPVRMIGNIQDITERKQAEITLQESAARYQAVVENQTEYIVRWKPDGTRTFVNEAYLRYFNLSREEALSSEFVSLVAEEDRRAVQDKISRLHSGESSTETDVHRVIKPDGNIGWQEWTDNAIYNDQGELVEFQSVGRDVTERKLADEALRTKTEELEALFSISSHLRSAQSADAMLPVVLAEMHRVLHSAANAIILYDPARELFTYALSDGPLEVNNGVQFDVERSISGLVLRNRRPYITEDLSSDPNKTIAIQGDEELGPAVVVPVVSESEFLGVLLCARKTGNNPQPYSSPEVRLLTAIGEMVGNALRRTRLYDQALTRLQQVQTLHSIDMAISANLDLSIILDMVLNQGIVQLEVDAASILLLNPHTHMLEYAAARGFSSKEIRSTRLRLGEGLPGRAVIERKVLEISNLSNTDKLIRKYLMNEGFVSYQVAPLIAKGQLHGVIEVFKRESMTTNGEQLGFLETLATQAAIAIDNSQLFNDLQRSNFELEMAYDATIEGWSRALELRDLETEGHTLRVTDMTIQLAQAMVVRSADLIHIRRGALLHDIGKMGVPDRILLKPGELNGEEWEIMKRHTVYAFEMLWPIEFLRPTLDIPHYHHERWDGTGYPSHLKGEQIPLSARLFAVADVWDALTSDRPYRKAWSENEALDYITTQAGKHFDPRVVDTFLILQNKNSQKNTI